MHLDRYEIIEKINSGGMSDVFSAKDTLLNQLVVIKTNNLNYTPTKILENESNVLEKLKNKHIIKKIDYFHVNNKEYLVLEYLPGGNLKQLLLKKGSMPPYVIVTILMSILEALIEIHYEGIAHLDIKPENILIDSFGSIKIADFGLSYLKNKNLFKKEIFGTIKYLPPEMIFEKSNYSYDTDLYELTITAIELILGQNPFDANQEQDIIEIKKNDFFQKKIINAVGIPEDLKTLLLVNSSSDKSLRDLTADSYLEKVKEIFRKNDYKKFYFTKIEENNLQLESNNEDKLLRIYPKILYKLSFILFIFFGCFLSIEIGRDIFLWFFN